MRLTDAESVLLRVRLAVVLYPDGDEILGTEKDHHARKSVDGSGNYIHRIRIDP